MDINANPGDFVGPPSYANWKMYLEGVPSYAAFEFPLYTDAVNLIGDINRGIEPYQFFNLIAKVPTHGVVREALTVRCEQVLVHDSHILDVTSEGYYHGGDASDEIAALASLILGVRLKAGVISRQFSRRGDPRGRPYAFTTNLLPPTTVSIGQEGRPVLPFAFLERPILDLKKLSKYPRIKPDDAITLVRAARLYQDALWFAESEPNLAWLLLVAAIETAAVHWRKSQETPLEKLEASQPELLDYLNGLDIEGLPDKVAHHIHKSLGVTRKFVDFVITHLPAPPEIRPPDEWTRVSWQEGDMRRLLRKIYTHRSNALHSGVPFPAPMCFPPFHYGDGDEGWYDEIPLGEAAYSKGGSWLVEDTPILLHTFEYIARKSLLKWWDTLQA